MTYGGDATSRKNPVAFTREIAGALEAIGVLNKGSSTTPAAPDPAEVGRGVQPISSNALNVTRITGVAGLVASIGAIAFALFGLNKATDSPVVVIAGYASLGAIVLAALFTVAIVVSSDIRARTQIAVATSPSNAMPPSPSSIMEIHASTTLDDCIDNIRVNAAERAVVVTLPDATRNPGRRVTIKRIDDSQHDVSVDSKFGQAIDGSVSKTLPRQWDVARLYSTGSDWEIE